MEGEVLPPPSSQVKMSRELRRRLHQVDPDLRIVSGRKRTTKEISMKALPRVLTPEEVKQWGLPEMIPIFPPDEVLAIEAMWSKYDLQQMARDYFLSPVGDKALLVEKLIYIGALDKEGVATGMPREPAAVPYVVGGPKQFCCRLCGACAPPELLKEGRFFDRMDWLRQHYKEKHPGVWGKRGGYVPSVERVKDKWYLGEWWTFEYSSAEAVVYRSKDRKKRLYIFWDGTREVKSAPEGIPQTTPKVDLRKDYDEMAKVGGGTLYRKGNTIQVWWDEWGPETWSDVVDVKTAFNEMQERWAEVQSTREKRMRERG
jgi:hypothetical protein